MASQNEPIPLHHLYHIIVKPEPATTLEEGGEEEGELEDREEKMKGGKGRRAVMTKEDQRALTM